MMCHHASPLLQAHQSTSPVCQRQSHVTYGSITVHTINTCLSGEGARVGLDRGMHVHVHVP